MTALFSRAASRLVTQVHYSLAVCPYFAFGVFLSVQFSFSSRFPLIRQGALLVGEAWVVLISHEPALLASAVGSFLENSSLICLVCLV